MRLDMQLNVFPLKNYVKQGMRGLDLLNAGGLVYLIVTLELDRNHKFVVQVAGPEYIAGELVFRRNGICGMLRLQEEGALE